MGARDKKTASRVAVAILLALLLTGCGRAPAAKGEIMDVAAAPATSFPEPQLVSDDMEQIAQGANAFAFRFSHALIEKTQPDANFICSPFSVWLPLAALAGATDQAALPGLLESLSEAGADADQLNSAASAMLYGLTRAQENEWRQQDGMEPHNPLSIANAVFVGDEYELNPGFAKTFADSYGGAAISVDFSSSDAPEKINNWASENTNGLISKLVDKFDPETVTALANAIYFSDRWSWRFDESETKADIFHSPTGDCEAFFMLREGEDQYYYEDDELEAVRLDFVMGGGMLVLLPKNKDAQSLLLGLDEPKFSDILDKLESREGKLLLPRFEIQSDAMDLNDAFKALGVPLLDPGSPALSGLVEGRDDLFISQALQSACVKVDEQGTTAAAVTVMAVTGASLPLPGERFEMVCDSPFAFVLFENSVDGCPQILFTGVVNQPEK